MDWNIRDDGGGLDILIEERGLNGAEHLETVN